MARTYTLKRRAEQQSETRRRIVEAAVELHGTVGPAATTVTMVAERAGVQRHTFYAHFPDERSLLMACSGMAQERDPMPDPAGWPAIADRRERLRVALSQVYGWYARNARLTACVLRDAEHHAPTREVAELRRGPVMAGYRAALGEGLDERQRALLLLALGFHTWRTLTQGGGLATEAAARTMAEVVAGEPATPRPGQGRSPGQMT